ncbi:MAG: CYTH domain-containing protein [Eubacterium sp.]
MEIERKFLIRQLPEHLEQYPCLQIEQGYLCTNPVVRIRKQDDSYFLTYKSGGLMTREEYNLPLTAESYAHLRKKNRWTAHHQKALLYSVGFLYH